ncbi:hypothetical protein BJ742DRAFT_786877 [Cladochytrium replicatum]|nr:hypothetical protein BJ742DRAFT_786877 [Cladochytrium replicatum]
MSTPPKDRPPAMLSSPTETDGSFGLGPPSLDSPTTPPPLNIVSRRSHRPISDIPSDWPSPPSPPLHQPTPIHPTPRSNYDLVRTESQSSAESDTSTPASPISPNPSRKPGSRRNSLTSLLQLPSFKRRQNPTDDAVEEELPEDVAEEGAEEEAEAVGWNLAFRVMKEMSEFGSDLTVFLLGPRRYDPRRRDGILGTALRSVLENDAKLVMDAEDTVEEREKALQRHAQIMREALAAVPQPQWNIGKFLDGIETAFQGIAAAMATARSRKHTAIGVGFMVGVTGVGYTIGEAAPWLARLIRWTFHSLIVRVPIVGNLTAVVSDLSMDIVVAAVVWLFVTLPRAKPAGVVALGEEYFSLVARYAYPFALDRTFIEVIRTASLQRQFSPGVARLILRFCRCLDSVAPAPTVLDSTKGPEEEEPPVRRRETVPGNHVDPFEDSKLQKRHSMPARTTGSTSHIDMETPTVTTTPGNPRNTLRKKTSFNDVANFIFPQRRPSSGSISLHRRPSTGSLRDTSDYDGSRSITPDGEDVPPPPYDIVTPSANAPKEATPVPPVKAVTPDGTPKGELKRRRRHHRDSRSRHSKSTSQLAVQLQNLLKKIYTTFRLSLNNNMPWVPRLTAYLIRFVRRNALLLLLSLSLRAAALLRPQPVFSAAVVIGATWAYLNRYLGADGASLCGLLCLMSPPFRRWVASMGALRAVIGLRMLSKEIVEPYLSRSLMNQDQRGAWFGRNEVFLTGFAFGFWIILLFAPTWLHPVTFAIAQAAAGRLVVDAFDPFDVRNSAVLAETFRTTSSESREAVLARELSNERVIQVEDPTTLPQTKTPAPKTPRVQPSPAPSIFGIHLPFFSQTPPPPTGGNTPTPYDPPTPSLRPTAPPGTPGISTPYITRFTTPRPSSVPPRTPGQGPQTPGSLLSMFTSFPSLSSRTPAPENPNSTLGPPVPFSLNVPTPDDSIGPQPPSPSGATLFSPFMRAQKRRPGTEKQNDNGFSSADV